MPYLHRFAALAFVCLIAFGFVTRPARAQGARAIIGGAITDEAGVRQPGITIVLTQPSGIDRRSTSNVEGTYVFGGLLPGEYRIRVDDPTNRYAPFSQDRIVVAAGDTRTINITLTPRVQPGAPAGISGTVLGPTGVPLAGATVSLSGTGGDRRTTSDRNGAFEFPDLAAGTYRIQVTVTEALPYASGDITLGAGERRQANVGLQPLPPPTPPPPPPPTPVQPPPPPPPTVNTTAAAGAGNRVAPPPPPVVAASDAPGLEAKIDRWNFKYPSYQRYAPAQRMPFVSSHPLDPYNQNVLKGDFPIGDHKFLNVNLQANSQINPQEVTGSPLGPLKKLVFNQNLVGGVELFGGTTVFEPKRWAARVTTVVNLNAASVGDFSLGAFKRKVAVEELFGEGRIAVLGPSFDFMSVRGGMQNFNSDFRGYMFVDNQLGVRLFGNASSNRRQYNVAFFEMVGRDATQLHDLSVRTGQKVLIANYFVQDFLTPGYTAMVNVHLNQDSRPSIVGTAGDLSAMYVGVHGDGHWGAWSVSHAFYQAFGHDDGNRLGLALGRPSHLTINARMAAIELSRDSDARRVRASVFYASGDNTLTPGTAGGFDSITDNPNLAGGQFMFWTQQGITVPSVTSAPLVSQKFSLLPNLRDKFTQRANFLNPGLLVLNAGVDLRLSPSLKLVTNGSFLRFADASVLRQLTSPATFPDATIGIDVSGGVKWRPFVNENLFVVGGASSLIPRGGFATALGSNRPLYSLFTAVQVAF